MSNKEQLLILLAMIIVVLFLALSVAGEAGGASYLMEVCNDCDQF